MHMPIQLSVQGPQMLTNLKHELVKVPFRDISTLLARYLPNFQVRRQFFGQDFACHLKKKENYVKIRLMFIVYIEITEIY